MDERSSLLQKVVTYGRKKFYNIDTWTELSSEKSSKAAPDVRGALRAVMPSWPAERLRGLAVCKKCYKTFWDRNEELLGRQD